MSYAALKVRFAQLSSLENAMAILHWDAATMMPAKSHETRGETLASLSHFAHTLLIAPEMPDYLAQAHTENLTQVDARNLALMQRRYLHAASIPADLVSAHSKAGSRCEMAWRQAKPENDFAGYAPLQQEVLNLTREIAHIKAEALQTTPYQAMLDSYEEGLEEAEIDAIFTQLQPALHTLLPRIQETQAAWSTPSFSSVSVEKQQILGREAARLLGFDFERGRMDESAHPFCGGVPGDVRITTRYNTDDFSSALMGVLHETGHALYEQHLPQDWQGQPAGQALGMAMHESQSLLVEMQLCRSPAFLRFLLPHLKRIFGTNYTAQQLTQHYHYVTPSFIRVDADEVTYPLHIMLRYRLEKELISGALKVSDLVERWNQLSHELLGITPPNPAEGCMQDIHWTDGSFGYFPTYTFGALIAAQLFATFTQHRPNWEQDIENGHFAPLKNWLQTHVHSQGSLKPRNQLLEDITGAPLDPHFFIDHLHTRYTDSS